MPLFRRKPEVARTRFWTWFRDHEDDLYESVESPTTDIHARLTTKLRRVDRHLVWELDLSEDEVGRRAFVISADGNPRAFNAVEALADMAPPLRRFRVQRFRRPFPGFAEMTLDLNGHRVSAQDIQFAARQQEPGGAIDLLLFMPGCPEPDHPPSLHAAFLMLDTALGEYDVACRVGELHVVPADMDLDGVETKPFAEVRAAVCGEDM